MLFLMATAFFNSLYCYMTSNVFFAFHKYNIFAFKIAFLFKFHSF